MDTISALFSKQANLTPEGIALIFENEKLTYQQLEERSNQLAHYLINNGVTKEELIPICLNRSMEMIVGILGILKAGCAYVPIDPEYPRERITYILKDTRSKIIITNEENNKLISSLAQEIEIISIDSNWDAITKMPTSLPEVDLQPDNLAYIIYTSGSTGTPKGVMIEHHNVVRLFFNEAPLYNFNENDVWPLFHSFCFDVSVWEMYGCLLFGGKLVIVPKHIAQNASEFGKLLQEHKVTILNQTPSAFYILQESILASQTFPLQLRYIIFAGEALDPSKLKIWKERYSDCKLINMYGITETTVHATYKEITAAHTNSSKSVVGAPIPTLYIYVLDQNKEKSDIGVEGEIYVGGEGLARGYLNLPELSAARFIQDPFSSDPNARLYRSGDLAILLADGTFEYLGRMDDQVKVNGFRIELGEIASNINQFDNIDQCIVLAKETNFGEKKLVAYYQSSTSIDQQRLLKFLLDKMPAYMVPRIFVPIKAIPLTSNGKADKRALCQIKIERPELASLYKKPQSTIEKNIYDVWSTFLEIDQIGVNDNFFELGGNSLLAQRTIAILKNTYQYNLPITKVYQLPTIAALAKYLDKTTGKNLESTIEASAKNTSSAIAVIGMAGRFPGADTIDELWELLVEGKEAITFFDTETLDQSIPDNVKNDPSYVKARGIINNADLFDPAFFGINPKLAELMDPQQRIFLEIAWEAMEKTGLLSQREKKKIGVFAGAGTNTYFENNVLAYPELIENQGRVQTMSVNEKDYIASRTAYHLNLRGPGVSVNSACSTSLLAIAEAVNSLRAGQCEVALAGAASITSPINSGHLYQEGSMLSADGHCTPFNAASTGTLFSDGAGVVVLKTLEAAEREGDCIFAIIKGIGVNNDGAGKGSFTAPSAEGQADAISSAIKDAQVSATDITYIEAHGTATPLGDPIEFEGLVEAFGQQNQNQYCAIGSIKSNMGHLTHAAGVAGFIKTCLALHHKMIPASLGYHKPNPHIDFKNSPFYVNAKLTEWIDEKPRIAGVSSFGVGGTNVHVVLESYDNNENTPSKSKPFELISWSAKNAKSMAKFEDALAKDLQQNTDKALADIAYTLHAGRETFKHRKFAVCESKSQLVNLLFTDQIPVSDSNLLTEAPDEIVFSFPGQGAQYVNMGLALYQQEPVYKAAIDQCATILKNYLDKDIRSIIFASSDVKSASNQLKNTKYTQPALFVTSYALAQLWMSWGVQPTMFIGHSVGEYVAAHFAGVFSLEDGLKLVSSRGLLISQLPSGSMLSVRDEASKIKNLLTEDLSIAAVNSAKLCVVAGPTDQIAEFAKLLDQQEIPNKPLFTSHAFHSSMMDPIINDYKTVVSTVSLSPPNIKIISTVTGEILSDEQAIDPNYWTTHLRKTVEFVKAVETVLSYNLPLFLEVGPGAVTTTLIKQIASSNKKKIKAINSLDQNQDALASTLNALGHLWNNGVHINWDAFYTNQKIVDLPTYQFDRQKYWLTPKQNFTETSLAENPITHLVSAKTSDQTIMRKERLTQEIKQVLEDASGIEMNDVDNNQNFLEIGFDSLLLTQVATSLKRKFNLPITFRKLNEEYASISSLASYLDGNMPETIQTEPKTVSTPIYNAPISVMQPQLTADNTALGLIAQQLNILTQQLMLLQGQSTASQPEPLPVQHTPNVMQNQAKVNMPSLDNGLSQEEKAEIQKPFGATPKIERQSTTISPSQKDFIKNLSERYNIKTAKSKAYTNESRPYMADPRVVSGFKPATKELIYPIVINKSKGSRMWDIDGNEYIDALNGFGSNMLGYQPDVIKNAMQNQLEKGYEVGPQHELAASVSKLVCEFTGFDRSALCSTGSEAVLGCIRIARTVTGRSLIVAFTGSYHGIVDEVLVRGTKKLKSFPAAAGIMPEAVQNILVLDYGTPESMAIIKERGDEIAAVLVETIQSRRPEFVPVDFLKELRTVTKEIGSVLIFDEVITGFRFHPGGAQAIFGIKADLAAYGKVVGAGIPIGVIAGDSYLMDALDGGIWNYGDASFPEIGVTYFAGTFVRHPLALASAFASLSYMKEKGPQLQKELNEKGNYISKVLNKEFEKRNLPIYVANYGSMWKVKYHEELAYSELLFVLLREKGIHILDGFPCFMTEATSASDIEDIISAFIEGMDEMVEAGFFPSSVNTDKIFDPKAIVIEGNNPPMAGARLGKDQFGNPAWFIQDPENETNYLQLGKH
ncbi:polyketide synthase [Pedobacter namyangjuensis]|uniref:polyketide synthase n=1 Tax=Pedobacter namyangjuensis TaxID=600626 RepID=UPI000DE22612|nr:polyketide synthase [Pedobacter namyangjuensis]